MAQFVSVNVPGLGKLKLGDYLHTRLRSAIRPATSQATDLSFFKNTVGQAIAGDTNTNLSEYDTNVKQNDGLPPGWAALVYYLCLQFPQSITLADLRDINAKALFRLIIGSTDKPLDEGHMLNYPTGGGIWSNLNDSGSDQVNNGYPSGGARTPYAIPHLISSAPKVPFQVKVTFSGGALANTARWTWFCDLEGIFRQPVA